MKLESVKLDMTPDDAPKPKPRRGRKPAAERKTDPAAADGAIVVKKYANRRLYNTATSSYVTLDNLAAMVRDGQDFVVQDARSGENITRAVLTQIIFEEEARGREPMLPISFLRQLIRLYGDTLQSYVPGYLEMTMAAFEKNQAAFREHMERSFGAAPGYAQLDAMTRANADMFRKTLEMITVFSAQGAEALNSARAAGLRDEAAGEGDEADLEALKRQLTEMQRKVDALADRD